MSQPVAQRHQIGAALPAFFSFFYLRYVIGGALPAAAERLGLLQQGDQKVHLPGRELGGEHVGADRAALADALCQRGVNLAERGGGEIGNVLRLSGTANTNRFIITNEEFDGLIEKYKISRRCLDDKDPTFVFVAKSY